jgi:hypothetical protein
LTVPSTTDWLDRHLPFWGAAAGVGLALLALHAVRNEQKI